MDRIREFRVPSAETMQHTVKRLGTVALYPSSSSSALSESPSSPLPLKIVIVREDREGSGNQKCLKVGKGRCKVVSPLSCTCEYTTKSRVQHEGWGRIRGPEAFLVQVSSAFFAQHHGRSHTMAT